VSEFTLGGYMALHDRAPAFTGLDGRAYSVALWIEDEPDAQGRHAGALLFVRWDHGGAAPDGHFETDWLVRGASVEDARERLGAFSLYDVKEMLDELINAGRAEDF
jgi:hypothetical protein